MLKYAYIYQIFLCCTSLYTDIMNQLLNPHVIMRVKIVLTFLPFCKYNLK